MKRFCHSGMRFLAVMAVAACGLWACDKPATEPTPGPDPGPGPDPVTLVDQLMYDGEDAVDIKSVIWQQGEDNTYTFWFSPEENITTVEDMEDSEGVLRVVVSKAEGTVAVESELVDLQYEDIHIMPQTMGDVRRCELSVKLASDDHVTLSLDAEMSSGKTLAAEYDNTCVKVGTEEEPLDNQFDLNGTISELQSAVAQYSVGTNVTVWKFYTQAGGPSSEEGAAIEFTVKGAPASLKADMSDTETLSLTCGDFSNTATTAGTLSLTVEGTNVTLSIDATDGADRLRAEYSGAFTSVADSPESHIKVVDAGGTTVVDAALPAVFRKADASTVRLVFGDASDPAVPEDLMSGKYALDLSIPAMYVTANGREMDYNDITGLAYDYATEYASWPVEEAESCSVFIRKTGENSLYMTFSIQLTDGPLFEGTWYGDVTDVDEIPDLTPVEPVESTIIFTDPSGAALSRSVILSMQVRKQSALELNGGSDNAAYGGATFDAYVFYFLTEYSNENNVDANSELSYTPRLTIPVSMVTGETVNIAETGQPWQFRYNNSNLLYGSVTYGQDYQGSYSTTYQCPDDAAVTVSFDSQTKVWRVTFSVTDMISKKPYGQGTGNKMVIEWEGMATKYTGSNPNEIPDSDYM